MATKTYQFLTGAQVRQICVTHVVDATPIQPNLLDSAISPPINIKHYEKQLDIFRLTASLSEKIINVTDLL